MDVDGKVPIPEFMAVCPRQLVQVPPLVSLFFPSLLPTSSPNEQHAQAPSFSPVLLPAWVHLALPPFPDLSTARSCPVAALLTAAECAGWASPVIDQDLKLVPGHPPLCGAAPASGRWSCSLCMEGAVGWDWSLPGNGVPSSAGAVHQASCWLCQDWQPLPSAGHQALEVRDVGPLLILPSSASWPPFSLMECPPQSDETVCAPCVNSAPPGT